MPTLLARTLGQASAHLRSDTATHLCVALVLALAFVLPPTAHGQYQVLYSLTGGPDGADPNGVTLDAGGNLYVTAMHGGGGDCVGGCGTVFKLTHTSSTLLFNRLYAFSIVDGSNPPSGV